MEDMSTVSIYPYRAIGTVFVLSLVTAQPVQIGMAQ
jgi:hypothetical protein